MYFPADKGITNCKYFPSPLLLPAFYPDPKDAFVKKPKLFNLYRQDINRPILGPIYVAITRQQGAICNGWCRILAFAWT